MKKHTSYTGILASALFLAGSLFFSACSDEDMFDSSTTIPTGEGIFFGTSIGNGSQWTPDVIGRSAKEEKQKPLVIEGEDGFSITATVEDGIKLRNNEPKPQSRGTQVTQAAEVTAFDVAAYKNVNNTYEHYFTETVDDGVNPSEKRFWPSKGTVDFIATYPKGLFSNQFPTAAQYAEGFSFNYTVKDNVEEQEDIMVAWPKGLNNGQDGTAVPLQFQHLLAAVQFKVGKMQFIQIHSLKVTGVHGGDITFTNNNGVWVPSSTTTTEYDLTDIIADTSGLVEGDEITSNKNNSIMLVAPQTLPEGAKIVVNYTETITDLTYTKEATLSGEWVAGKTTTYALNISGTDFGTVEIPRPDDQDAHYIMLNMSYNMGNILSNKNIKSVKATAQWLKDENGNDISGNNSTKSGISLKFAGELTETQKQGFWTDKRYVETITVESGSSSSTGLLLDTTTDSHGNTGLRGGNSLNITDANGNIVLFIEENNGTTDREGELLFTATLTSNVEIVLGKGEFKQLCPSWNNAGIGIERIETDNKSYAYGFDYTRKVVYNNPANNIAWIPIIGWIAQVLYSWGASSIITDDEGDFITINQSGWVIESVTLDYGALSKVQEIANSENGLANTQALYNFTGGVDIGQIETDFDENLGWRKSTPAEGEGTPEDYAAFMALSRNRMYEKKTVVNSSEGNTTTYKAVLYKDGATDLEGNDIIEWYLPSSVEAQSLVETGVDDDGNESVIDDLNGTYWSSTAGSNTTPAQAYTFTYNSNAYSSIQPAARTEKHKVRAVRKKP